MDPTGGAGITCDVRVCAGLKVRQVSVITGLVIQDLREVCQLVWIEPGAVRKQLRELKKDYDFPIVNVSLFGSIEILEFIAREFKEHKIILDPIFFSGSGRFRFFDLSRLDALKRVLKQVYLLTPNIPEAERLIGQKILDLADMKTAALRLQKLGARHVLLKGGHLQTTPAYDVLLCGSAIHVYENRLRPFRIHGTGSFLNAAVAAHVYQGHRLQESVARARQLLSKSARKATPADPFLDVQF